MISIPKTARKYSHLGLHSIDAMLAPTVAAPASPPIVSEIKVGFSDIDAKTEGSGPPPPSARRTSGAPASSRSITSVTTLARTAHKGGAVILSRRVLLGRVRSGASQWTVKSLRSVLDERNFRLWTVKSPSAV